jgi:hypothetical protein
MCCALRRRVVLCLSCVHYAIAASDGATFCGGEMGLVGPEGLEPPTKAL